MKVLSKGNRSPSPTIANVATDSLASCFEVGRCSRSCESVAISSLARNQNLQDNVRLTS